MMMDVRAQVEWEMRNDDSDESRPHTCQAVSHTR